MSCSLGYTFSVTGDCTNSNLGAFSLDIFGSAPNYTIQWVNPSSGSTSLAAGVTNYSISGLSADTYVLNIIDSCVPTNTVQTVNIYVSSGTCASITSIENTTCGLNNGSLTATTTNYYNTSTFSLYNDNNDFIFSATSLNGVYEFIGFLSADTYYVVVDDGGGCTGKTQTCIVKSSTTVDYGFYIVSDAGCSVDSGKIFVTGVTGNPPYTYLWNNGATTSSITGLTASAYTVTVTDSTGCSVTKSAIVNNVPPIGLGSLVTTNPTCFTSNGSVEVTVTGGTAPYYYSGSNGNIQITFEPTYEFTNLASGPFTVQVTDAGLCTFSASTSVLPANGFAITSVSVNPTTCGNNSGSLNPIQIYGGSGNYTYTLFYPSGGSSSQSTTSQTWQFNNLSAGTYNLRIEDGTCIFISAYTITNVSDFILSATTTGTTCNLPNGSIHVIATGGTVPYVFEVDGQAFGPTTETGYTFTNLSSGVYVVSVTDNTGCTISQTYTVATSYNVDFILSAQNPNSGSNGIINAFITNGEPPFTLTWSSNVNGQTGTTITNLSGGTYTLTVVDSFGCTKTKTIQLLGTNLITSYQSYSICDTNFVNDGTQIKKGMREMLNEGFYDLTIDDENCVLNNAIFEIIIDVGETQLSKYFYTATTLNDYPSDNLWYDTIDQMLSLVNGIGNVIIDPETNSIKILTNCDPSVSLSDSQVLINLKINYNISCVACDVPPSPTPTPTITRTPNPTQTPGLSPSSTPTVTPTPTLTPFASPSPTPTPTLTPFASPTSTPTPTVTKTPTPTPTVTKTPTPTPTPTKTPQPTYLVWKIGQCGSICSGGISNCYSTSFINVYTNTSVSDITVPGTILYTDTSLTTQFNGFFKVGLQIYSASPVNTESIVGGPC